MNHPKAFYIPTNKNFLEELALGILARFDNISEISILLPSRRSCIALEKILQKHHKKSFLLPQIIPIGELGRETQLLENVPPQNIQKHLTEFEHRLLLTQIIYKKKLSKINYLKALSIATSLSSIIKQFTKNKIHLSKIKSLSFSDNALHTEEVLEYLYIISDEWPAFLQNNNFVDYLNDINIYIEHLIETWKTTPPCAPVIAAGSTGSIKSTSNLLKTLSELQNGFVILGGVDLHMNQNQWDNIEETHHAFLTKKLLTKIGVDKKELEVWHSENKDQNAWQNFVSLFMTPSKSTIEWHTLSENDNIKNQNIQLVECNNIQEEAMLITIKIREIIEEKTYSNIAIISNDTDLINRIIALSKIWNLPITNSYGTPLTTTNQYSLIISLLNAISENFSPIYLITLLKNPYFNIPIENFKQHILKLELTYLRGICRYDNLDQLIDLVKKDPQEEIVKILEYIERHCTNLIKYSTTKIINFKQCLKEIIKVAEIFSSYDIEENIWSDNCGDTLYKELYYIIETSHLIQKINFIDIPNILETLLQDKYVIEKNTSIIQILSNIESRLLSFDHVIISGLNEGTLPAKPALDPWFTNNICNSLKLSTPEQLIGKTAYDFFCLMHQKNILLTRSLTNNGSSTIPTRWLVRMETLAKKLGILEHIKPKNHYLKKYTKFFLYHNTINEAEKNQLPNPSISNSLKKLSVTQIEKLIRDPYSIFISKVLNIKKLDPIDKQPDQKDFGVFIHEIMDKFNKLYNTTQDHKNLLKTLSEKILNTITENKTIQHLWKLKFEPISDWIIAFENNKRAKEEIEIHTEINGNLHINHNVLLTMKADRIEVDKDTITIIDFKTGNIPTQQDIQDGFSPQLPLEALITTKGLIKDLEHLKKSNKKIQLIYIQISPGKNLGKSTLINITPEISPDYIEEKLSNLIRRFNNGAPFLISPRPSKAAKYNDIAHLERVE